MQRYQQIYISDLTGKIGIFNNPTNSSLITAIYEKTIADPVWTIKHNMNSDCFIVQIYTLNNELLELAEFVDLIKINDSNTISVYFNQPITGKLQIIFFTAITS